MRSKTRQTSAKRAIFLFTCALGILLALIVASFIEVRIRQELQKRERPFLVPGNRWTERPTMRMIFDLLEGIIILKVSDGSRTRRMLPSNIDPRIYELLDLAGLDHRVYTQIR